MNNYLIKKIHTLEDRINSRFEKEQKATEELVKASQSDTAKVEAMLNERDLKHQKVYRELKTSIMELKEELFQWSHNTLFERVLF